MGGASGSILTHGPRCSAVGLAGSGAGPSEVGSEFCRMTPGRGGEGAEEAESWTGKATVFLLGWSCSDWERGTGAA